MSVRKPLKNERGQGLIEYLIIVALMSVAAIAIVRTVSQSLNARFAEVAYALQGQKKSIASDAPDASQYKRKDLGNFIDGVADKGGSKSGSSSGSGGSSGGSSSGSSGSSSGSSSGGLFSGFTGGGQ